MYLPGNKGRSIVTTCYRNDKRDFRFNLTLKVEQCDSFLALEMAVYGDQKLSRNCIYRKSIF